MSPVSSDFVITYPNGRTAADLSCPTGCARSSFSHAHAGILDCPSDAAGVGSPGASQILILQSDLAEVRARCPMPLGCTTGIMLSTARWHNQARGEQACSTPLNGKAHTVTLEKFSGNPPGSARTKGLPQAMHFTLCQSPSSVFCHNQTPFQHFCSTVPSGCSQISTLTSILDTTTDGSTPVHIHFNFHHLHLTQALKFVQKSQLSHQKCVTHSPHLSLICGPLGVRI